MWRPTGLLPKYALWIIALVGMLLLISGAVSLYFAWRENEAHIDALQAEKARGAAARIQQYMADIEQQVGWTLLPGATTSADPLPQRRIEFLKLLRQAPPITDVAWIDNQGHEQVRVSRLTPDAMGQAEDRSTQPAFMHTQGGRTWRSAVTFRKDTEPYITVARRASSSGGVTVVDVNLKFVWEVVSALQLGRQGVAYVVDDHGNLIAHPDISLVLKKTNLAALPQVHAALLRGAEPDVDTQVDSAGRPVLAASARIEPLGWTVLVESPRSEALAPVYDSALRLGAVLLGSLLLAAMAGATLARNLVQPIRALGEGAARIGAGDLNHRIAVATRDELATLAERFNQMAANLQSIYATLESRVAERTHALAEANEAKSRFLAAASHDLRQPVHALGLFVGQLRAAPDDAARQQLIAHVEASVASFEGLLEALLDISRLDAGAVPVQRRAVALGPMLQHMAAGHALAAQRRGLRLRLRAPALWVDADPTLLERILHNLLSNALRYTPQGGLLLAARPRAGAVELLVVDTGVGIAPEQLPMIFREFYRVPGQRVGGDLGLGLGLAIVQRLAQLMGTRVDVSSRPGRGTCMRLRLPTARPGAAAGEPTPPHAPLSNGLAQRQVLVVDDEAAVREATRGQLAQWGLQVSVAATAGEALARMAQTPMPEVVLSDLRLADGEDGFELAQAIRQRHRVPVVLITGETTGAHLQAARDAGFAVLGKPLRPARLRALLESMFSRPVA